jgi:DnaD/phage-associated family protein
MAFTVKQTNELFLLDTSVENIFINEFMTGAPGDYVKVYLLSLMYANCGREADNAEIAKQLSLEEEDILKAWNYWEKHGIIRKKHKEPKDRFNYDVEFLCIKERRYGSKTKKDSNQENKLPELLNDTQLKNLYRNVERVTGRPLGGKEHTEIASWLSDYGASPEMIIYAYSYCVKNKKKDNPKYVGAVLKEWISKELLDVPAIESHLQEVDKRHFLYKRVLKAMGFTRNATEEEKRIMDTWFDEMEFSTEKVLEACSKTSGIPNPNFNYVNQILTNWFTGKTGGRKTGETGGKKAISIADVHRYYDKIRKQAEDDANERTEQIYAQIPRIKEIDEELRLCGMEMSRIMISGNANKKQQADKYKNKVNELSKQKADLLKENGYNADYIETKYKCETCKDSGINDNNERCSCFKETQKEAELWQISSKK